MIKIDQEELKNLCFEFKFSFVALFGSRVREGKFFKRDFDFAVLAEESLSDDKELELINRFSQILKSNDVDVVILNFASPLLQYEVAKESVLLYERTPGSFNNFRNLAIRKWDDNKKFIDLKLDYIKDFIKEKSLA